MPKALALIAALIACGVFAAQASARWGEPATVSTSPAESGRSQALAMLGDGRAVAVWGDRMQRNTGTGRMMYSVRGVNNTWSAPGFVDGTSIAGGDMATDPVLAAMPDGRVMAMWREGVEEEAIGGGLYSAIFDGTAWSSRVEVAPREGEESGTGIQPDGYELKFRSNGDGYAVWKADGVLKVARWAHGGTSWNSVGTGFSTSGYVRGPSLAISAQGKIAVVWNEDGVSSTSFNVFNGSSWVGAASIALSPTGWNSYSSQVVFDGETPVAVWAIRNDAGTNDSGVDLRRIMTARYVNATWTAPQELTGEAQEGIVPSLAVGPDGVITAAWDGSSDRTANEKQVQAARYVADQGWSSAVVVSGTSTEAVRPRVLAYNQGAMIAWYSAGRIRASAYRNGGWLPAADLGAGSFSLVQLARLDTALTNGLPVGVTALWFGESTRPTSSSLAASTQAEPEPPTGVNLTAQDGALGVAWTAPTVTGAWGVSEYVATASPGGQSCRTETTSCTITGLTNEQEYEVTVVAESPTGNSSPSAALSATPTVRPGAPTDIRVEPDYEAVRISWAAPAQAGAGISTYIATASPGNAQCIVDASARFCAIAGLENGRTYSIEVRARIASGEAGPPSVAQSAMPVARNGWVGPVHRFAREPINSGWNNLGVVTVAHAPDAARSLAVSFQRYDESGQTVTAYVAQVLDASGAPIGSPVTLPTSLDGWLSPTVVANPNGGWSVFYVSGQSCVGDTSESVNHSVLRMAQISANGSLDQSQADVFTGFCETPTIGVAWDSDRQRFLVTAALKIDHPTNAQDEVAYRGRLVNPDGTFAANAYTIRSYHDKSAQHVDLSYSPKSGTYLSVVYAKATGSDELHPIATLLDLNGLPVGGVPELHVAPRDVRSAAASVGYDAEDDQFVVVWSSHQNDSCTSVDPLEACGVWLRRIAASTGLPVGDPERIHVQTDTAIDAYRPRIAYNGYLDEVIVTWGEGGYWGPYHWVAGMRIGADGASVTGTPFRISGPADQYSLRPSVTFLPGSCSYLVGWSSYSDPAEQVYASTRRVASACAQRSLAVAKSGAGSGSVTSDVGGLDCGATCTTTIDWETPTAPSVTLTAAPASGSTFLGWTGACSGTATTCTLTMSEARVVGAQFGVAPQSTQPGASSDSERSVQPVKGGTSSSTTGFRMRGGMPRQVGDVVITTFEVPEAGRLVQAGRLVGVRGGSPVCRASQRVKKAQLVVLRCRVQRGRLLRQLTRLRASDVPIILTTRFIPADGGNAVERKVRFAVTATLPTVTPVTG